MKRFCGTKRGLTLLELVIVLVILASLATIAVSNLEPRVNQQRFEITQRLLEDIDNSIFHRQINADGTMTTSGFFVDLGGLPRAVQELDGSLSLGQLWRNQTATDPPTQFAEYQMRRVTPGNLENDDGNAAGDSDGESVVADREIIVGSGWRGPYLKLPMGADKLTDAWGHVLRSPGATGYSHLRSTGDQPVVHAGLEVIGVRSLGENNELDGTILGGNAYDSDLPQQLRLNQNQLFGTLTGSVRITSGKGSVDTIVVQAYYPDRDTGLIRAERATLSGPDVLGDGWDEYTFSFQDNMGNDVQFPVGPRAIRAYFAETPDTSGDFSDGNTDPPKSRPRYFEIQPQVNSIRNLMIVVASDPLPPEAGD